MDVEQQLVQSMAEEIGLEIDRAICRSAAPWYKRLWWSAKGIIPGARRWLRG